MIREALPLAGVIMVSIAYLRIDAILLSLLSTEQEVGAYGLAYRLASNVAIVSSIFANTVFAPTADAFAAGRDRFLRVVTRSLQFMLLAALPVAAFGWLLAGPVLDLIAPSDLADQSTSPAQLLLVAIACGFVNAVLAGALVAAHKQRTLLISSCIILVLNVVANLVLIPRYQATGSAAALVVSEGTATVVSVAILVRVTGWQVPWSFLTRLLLPIGVTFLVLLPLTDGPLWISVPVGAVVYVGGLWVLGPIRPPELLRVLRQPATLADPDVRSTG
jgi:O-antigen/teichoic acid export membrane protein